jgi:hypothetical protein
MGGTESGTLDADLAIVIEAWPRLDVGARSGIVDMVRKAVAGAT